MYRRNLKVGESVPDVADQLGQAGEDARRWVVVLPGGPAVQRPVWSPGASRPVVSPPTSPGQPRVLECPNCGAPLQLTPAGTCRWCSAPIRL